VESLGTRLKQERERKGITLDDVAVSTKIGTRMLQALEEERYELLPGGIFNKGFVRAYARHLGLNEEQAVADYMATTLPPAVAGEPVAVMEAMAAHAVVTRGERLTLLDRIPWGKLAIFLLVVAIALTIWGPRPQPTGKHKQENPPRSGLPPNPPAANLQRERYTADGDLSAGSRPVVTNQSSSPADIPVSGGFSLRIQANQYSWLAISADTKECFRAVLPAHSQKSIAANHEIVAKAGSIGGLEFWFNQQKLDPQGNLNQVKTLTFLASGLPILAHKNGIAEQFCRASVTARLGRRPRATSLRRDS
jgi:cytoskeleton protein RodZ